MSRIGNSPLTLPSGVTVTEEGRAVLVKGPKGEVRLHKPGGVKLTQEDGTLTVERLSNSKPDRAAHGTMRRLVGNAVAGVTEPYKRTLDIVGVGYQATLKGRQLVLKVGFANEITVDIPDDVQCEVPSTTRVTFTSCNKESVGAIAARTRKVRPPEPYNGKGIRYEGERIERKAGKSFASGG